MLSLHGYVAAEPELGMPDTGGQVVFVLELARRFAEEGYRVDIVTRQFDDQPEVEWINGDLKVWRIPFGGAEFIPKEEMHEHLDEFIGRFSTTVLKDGIKYRWIASHYWDAGYAGERLARLLQIPHIHTPHSLGRWKRADMGAISPEAEARYRFTERIEKETETLRNSDLVVATSRQQADMLTDDYEVSRNAIEIIPPGIDEDRYTPIPARRRRSLRKTLGFRDHDVYTVGRAAHNKGYDLLIRALPELRRQVPDARLQLAVGADSEADQANVDKWAGLAEELEVAEHVNWLGYIEDDDMADHYRAAPVFALPSRYEPFGMTAAEAMACGTPTVVTVHGGLEESLDFGHQALVADPERPREYAVMLSLPLRYRRLRERLSVAGAKFARKTLGWSRVAAQTLDAFRGAELRQPQRLVALTDDRRGG